MTAKFASFTEEENQAVKRILDRLQDNGDLFAGGIPLNWSTRDARRELRLHWSMNLAAVHAGYPLDLKALADADELTFRHDLAGIENHLDKETGQLSEHFLPRTLKMTKPEDGDEEE